MKKLPVVPKPRPWTAEEQRIAWESDKKRCMFGALKHC